MCNHFTLLAQQSEQRFIARCEHGTLHLNWDQVTVRLHPVDLLRAGYLLDQAQVHPEQDLFRAGTLGLVRDDQGNVQFWMANSCLYLPPVDFAQFGEMVRVVIAPSTPDPDICSPAHGQALCRYRKHRVTTQMNFSLN